MGENEFQSKLDYLGHKFSGAGCCSLKHQKKWSPFTQISVSIKYKILSNQDYFFRSSQHEFQVVFVLNHQFFWKRWQRWILYAFVELSNFKKNLKLFLVSIKNCQFGYQNHSSFVVGEVPRKFWLFLSDLVRKLIEESEKWCNFLLSLRYGQQPTEETRLNFLHQTSVPRHIWVDTCPFLRLRNCQAKFCDQGQTYISLRYYS